MAALVSTPGVQDSREFAIQSKNLPVVSVEAQSDEVESGNQASPRVMTRVLTVNVGAHGLTVDERDDLAAEIEVSMITPLVEFESELLNTVITVDGDGNRAIFSAVLEYQIEYVIEEDGPGVSLS
jgi:hypothetical protein